MRGHALFEAGEHGGADALALPVLGRREKDDPALRVGSATDCGADDFLAVHRDDGVVLLAGGQHFGEAVNRLGLGGRDLLPQLQDAIEIVRVEVSNAPTGHCGSLA